MPKYDIVALGESLIDFVVLPGKDKAKLNLEGNAGGAPANVLAAAAKLGRKTAFIGRVGRDVFGDFLRARIEEAGVDVSALIAAKEPTTLAMVSLDEKGDRSFRFYRDGTADVMLKESEVDRALVANSRVFHFGSVSMTTEPARSATLAAARFAREAGVTVSFDPNYRPLLWGEEKAAVAAMEEGVALAQFVKLSGEEAQMLTGEADPEKAALQLLTSYGLHFVAVTLGAEGCIGISPKARVRLPSYDVKSIDTTGAGDSFWGAVLHRLLAYRGSGGMDEKNMEATLRYGNAAGSLTTTRYGAIPSLPTEEEILHCVKTGKLLVLG